MSHSDRGASSPGEPTPDDPLARRVVEATPSRTLHDPRETPTTATDDRRETPTTATDDPRETRTRTRTPTDRRSPPRTEPRFPHEKLDAYRVALELAALARKLAERIPRGHRSIADHLQRAASNTVLLLPEGANRRGAGLKRQRFVESRGECGEVAAAADLLVVLGIGAAKDAAQLKVLAGRVAAMLTRLIAAAG